VANSCLQEALAYIKLGRPVIPIWWIKSDRTCACGRDCASPGKHPILPSWKEYQRSIPSEEQVRAWFKQYPEANAAMLTGSAGGQSILNVLDDDREGANPEFSTRTIRTGGGGLHYYFYSDKRYSSSANRQIHVRAEGGYVLIAGSNHESGERYVCIDSQTPVKPDRAAIKLFDPEAVFSGGRHDAAGKFIGHLFKAGKSVYEIRKALTEWNEEHVYPSLGTQELNRYLDDVATKEKTKERDTEVELDRSHFKPILEFLSIYTPTKYNWLVEKWVPSSSAGIISSLPGSYKTWLALELALSVATGKPFLGQFEVPAPKAVVFCQLEDDYTLLADRLRILLGGNMPTFEGNELVTVVHPNIKEMPIYLFDHRRFDIANDRNMHKLEEILGDVKAGLLLVDPMNAAVNMAEYGINSIQSLNRLKEIRDRLKTTLGFLHHDRKATLESSRNTTYGSVFLDAWKEFGWNITKTAPDAVKIKRHAKIVPYLSDVSVRFQLNIPSYEVEEEQ
jgi:hypothetical protein